MPDPRATASYEGIDYRALTLQADATIVFDATQRDGSASVGLAVTMTGNQTVGLAADGAPVLGKLLMVENDGRCAVQVEGYTSLPGGTGAALTPQAKVVGALGGAGGAARGYIRNAAASEVTLMGPTVMDTTDPTNVVVQLS